MKNLKGRIEVPTNHGHKGHGRRNKGGRQGKYRRSEFAKGYQERKEKKRTFDLGDF